MEPALSVLLPVGLGVVVGIVVAGNLLKFLLNRYRKATLGFLMGLLIGSVAGLWPFRVGKMPEIGEVIKGQRVTAESLPEIDHRNADRKFARLGCDRLGDHDRRFTNWRQGRWRSLSSTISKSTSLGVSPIVEAASFGPQARTRSGP